MSDHEQYQAPHITVVGSVEELTQATIPKTGSAMNDYILYQGVKYGPFPGGTVVS